MVKEKQEDNRKLFEGDNEMTTEAEKLVFTIKEAGEKLSLSRPSMYLAVQNKSIPFIRVGRRILIPKNALAVFLANAGQKEPAK